MTVRTHRVPLSDSLRAIEVRNPAGSVTVRAVEGTPELLVSIEPLGDDAEQVADRVDLAVTDSRLRVSVPERRLLRTPSFAIEVITPPGAEVRVAVGSAEVGLRGRLGRTEITGASGDIVVEHCTELELRAASGDVRVGTVEGVATVGTASGDVRLDSAGPGVQLRSASGDLSVGVAAGNVSARTASGDVAIGRASSGTVQLKTVSGDAAVAVAPGLRVWLDVQSISGRLHSELDDEGPDGGDGDRTTLAVVLQSVSGDLRIRRATPQPPTAPSAPAPPATPMSAPAQTPPAPVC